MFLFPGFGLVIYIFLRLILFFFPSADKDLTGQERFSDPDSKRVVYILIALNVIFFLFTFLASSSSNTSKEVILRWGGVDREIFLNPISVWRLLAAQFLHWDLMHIFANNLHLLFVGLFAASYLKWQTILLTYLVSGIVGFLTWGFYASSNELAAGASCGICGLYAFMVFSLFIRKEKDWWSEGSFVLATLATSLQFYKDLNSINLLHLGGTAAGLVLAILIFNLKKEGKT